MKIKTNSRDNKQHEAEALRTFSSKITAPDRRATRRACTTAPSLLGRPRRDVVRRTKSRTRARPADECESRRRRGPASRPTQTRAPPPLDRMRRKAGPPPVPTPSVWRALSPRPAGRMRRTMSAESVPRGVGELELGGHGRQWWQRREPGRLGRTPEAVKPKLSLLQVPAPRERSDKAESPLEHSLDSLDDIAMD